MWGAFERKRDQAREVVQLKMPLTVNAAVDRTLERKVQQVTTVTSYHCSAGAGSCVAETRAAARSGAG